MSNEIPAFPVSIYILDELAERGWSYHDAAKRLNSDDIVTDNLWLRLLCCTPAWYEHKIVFSEYDARQLAQIFGTSSEMWLNLAAAFDEARRKSAEVGD